MKRGGREGGAVSQCSAEGVVGHGLSRNFVVWCKLSPKRPFFLRPKNVHCVSWALMLLMFFFWANYGLNLVLLIMCVVDAT